MSTRNAAVFGSTSEIGKMIIHELSLDHNVIQVSRGSEIYSIDYAQPLFEQIDSNILTDILYADLFVFNQAFTSLGLIHNLSDADLEASYRINVIFPLKLIREVVKNHHSTKYRRFIFITSIAGSFRSETASVAYSSSKRALHGLIKHLSKELGQHHDFVGIAPSQVSSSSLRANCTRETIINLAKCHPTGQLCTPQEIAYLVRTIANYPGRHINGTIIDLNGGLF